MTAPEEARLRAIDLAKFFVIHYIEISIRSTIDAGAPPFHTLSFYIDRLRLIDRH